MIQNSWIVPLSTLGLITFSSKKPEKNNKVKILKNKASKKADVIKRNTESAYQTIPPKD